MKFSPTIPLALALAAGMAAAAAAQTTSQTTAIPGGSTSTTPQVIAPTTPSGSNLGQQGYSDTKATPTQQMNATEAKGKPTAQMKVKETAGKPTAQLNATPTKVKRTAQLRTKHTKIGKQAKIGRLAQMRRPPAQAQNFTPDQVKGAQEQLRSAGLYNGPTDGMMDPDTRAALARFQQQNGLRRTETLDPQTLARLNSPQTTGFGSSTMPNGNQGTTTAPTGAGASTTQQPTTH